MPHGLELWEALCDAVRGEQGEPAHWELEALGESLMGWEGVEEAGCLEGCLPQVAGPSQPLLLAQVAGFL